MDIAVPFPLKVRRVPANPTKHGQVIDADLPLGQKAPDIAREESLYSRYQRTEMTMTSARKWPPFELVQA
jgi:hypothetical protein